MLVLPQQGIEIAYPAGYEMPYLTSIFRPDSRVKEGVEALVGLCPDQSERTVYSLGCSIGAEAYSAGAALALLEPDSNVAVSGYDVSDEVLAIAKAGRFKTKPVAADPWEKEKHEQIEATEATLEGLGFSVEGREVESRRRTDSNGKSRYIPHHSTVFNADPLKDKIEVEFDKRDILEISIRDAGLIFLCNVLYHLRPESAYRAVMSAAEGLNTDASVLVIGDSRRFNSVDDPDAKRFREFLDEVTVDLRDHFGQEPIAWDKRGNPTIFATA